LVVSFESFPAAAEALSSGWEHWDRIGEMANPAGYLYRTGQTAERKARRATPIADTVEHASIPDVEPAVIPALADLSESQRICVLLVVAFGWTRVGNRRTARHRRVHRSNPSAPGVDPPAHRLGGIH